MKENKIKLPNRYNEEVYLEEVENNKYKLIHNSPYIRRGTINKEKNQLAFIDIEGGSMISLEDKLPIGIVKSISDVDGDYIIEVET